MKILVCISHVPDTTSKINFIENNTRFDTTGVQFIIGPYDDYALARAMLAPPKQNLHSGKRWPLEPMMLFALMQIQRTLSL